MATEIVKRGISERSALTNDILSHLIEGHTEVSYAELAQKFGVDPQAAGRPALNSARRIAEREHKLLYQCVVGVGLRLVVANDVPKVGKQSIGRIHREAARGIRRMGCADPSKMDKAALVQFNTVASGLGAIALVSQARQLKKIEAVVEKLQAKPTLTQTLALFNGGKEE